MILISTEHLRRESCLTPVQAGSHLHSCRPTILTVRQSASLLQRKSHFYPCWHKTSCCQTHWRIYQEIGMQCHSTPAHLCLIFQSNTRAATETTFLHKANSKHKLLTGLIVKRQSANEPVEQSEPVHCGSQLQSPTSRRKVPCPEHCSWQMGSDVSQFTPPQPAEQWHSP